ncbi:hypothetical protein ACVJBD_000102 [Rhizobium mongolense]
MPLLDCKWETVSGASEIAHWRLHDDNVLQRNFEFAASAAAISGVWRLSAEDGPPEIGALVGSDWILASRNPLKIIGMTSPPG